MARRDQCGARIRPSALSGNAARSCPERPRPRERVFPFRFLAAARYVPQWEEALERAMPSSRSEQQKLPGRTVLLVDVSGPMTAPLSRRSEMLGTDAAYGLAILLREICKKADTLRTVSVQFRPESQSDDRRIRGAKPLLLGQPQSVSKVLKTNTWSTHDAACSRA